MGRILIPLASLTRTINFSISTKELAAVADADEKEKETEVETVEVSVSVESETPTEETPVAEVPVEETAETEETPESDKDKDSELSNPRAECKRFADAFGDSGPVWYAEGLTFEDAQKRQLAELRAENADLRKRLSAGDLSGEAEPVSGDAGKLERKTRGFASKIKIK